jgi:hypothetical protein
LTLKEEEEEEKIEKEGKKKRKKSRKRIVYGNEYMYSISFYLFISFKIK